MKPLIRVCESDFAKKIPAPGPHEESKAARRGAQRTQSERLPSHPTLIAGPKLMSHHVALGRQDKSAQCLRRPLCR